MPCSPSQAASGSAWNRPDQMSLPAMRFPMHPASPSLHIRPHWRVPGWLFTPSLVTAPGARPMRLATEVHTMSEHTPGPWVLDTIQTSVGICHRIGPFPPRRPDDETVRHACLYADYPSACNPADKELEANARLIAAAPELLEALELVIKEHAPSYHDCLDDGEPECAWCVASKAIAKARVNP